MTSASGDRPPLDVLVIGSGQAGLAMGHQLTRLGLRFQIVAQATIATTSAATSLRRPLGPDGLARTLGVPRRRALGWAHDGGPPNTRRTVDGLDHPASSVTERG